MVSVCHDCVVSYHSCHPEVQRDTGINRDGCAGPDRRIFQKYRRFFVHVPYSGIWSVFYLGYYMEQPVLERALRPVYRRVVVPAAVAICAGILAFGSKLKDELGMVYENISYYELDDVWEGPFVRLALMIAAFLISWAIMFFVPRGKTCLSVIGQNTMPVYMLHRILRDILMFAGIYDYLGDWGWFALFVLICLSICVIYLLVHPKVVNQVNKILTLYTPRLWGRIRRNQEI